MAFFGKLFRDFHIKRLAAKIRVRKKLTQNSFAGVIDEAGWLFFCADAAFDEHELLCFKGAGVLFFELLGRG
jgi:hypothetical protein